jgi:hypothetical protein
MIHSDWPEEIKSGPECSTHYLSAAIRNVCRDNLPESKTAHQALPAGLTSTPSIFFIV